MGTAATSVRARCRLVGKYILFCVLAALSLIQTATAAEKPPWRTLPETPKLPTASQEGYVSAGGAEIWYGVYGSGEPVIMLHGGLANSDYWGYQVPELAKRYQVVVIDSRGHGRSTRDTNDFTYDLMSSDVIAVMDRLNVSKADIVGWSDGAIIALKLAIGSPDRISGVFAFGANSDPSGMYDVSDSIIFKEYLQRTRNEYESSSRTSGEYEEFAGQMQKMWASQPDLTKKDLRGIQVPTWIAGGDHEEVVKRSNTLFLADNIPNCGLLIQPGVSHFSPLQNPQQFTEDVLRFLVDY